MQSIENLLSGHLWIVIEAEWIIIGCDYELTVLKALLSLIFSSQFVQLIVSHIAHRSLFTRTFLIAEAKQIQCLKTLESHPDQT